MNKSLKAFLLGYYKFYVVLYYQYYNKTMYFYTYNQANDFIESISNHHQGCFDFCGKHIFTQDKSFYSRFTKKRIIVI